MKGAFPIFAVLLAGALFYFYVDPTYDTIKTLRAEEATLNAALSRALELQTTRDQLISRYNTFAPEDLARLEKLLPDHVDNVRLVLDMDSLASQYGMRVRNVAVEKQETQKNTRTQKVGPDERAYESMLLSFTVNGEYSTFRAFLRDLEQSLRLVDVESVSFSATDTGFYDVTVTLRTYWLKP